MLVFLQQQFRFWSDMASGESAFSLVELLVALLILAVLATIGLPLLMDQADKAKDANAKSVAHAAQVAMESCMTDQDGHYDSCDVDALRALDPSLPGEPKLKVTVPAKGTSYTLKVQSDPKTQVYEVKRSVKGALTFPCKKVAVAGCPASGSWG